MTLEERTFRLGGELEVKRLGFGAMRITGAGIWGEPESPERARELLRHVVESGVNLIDTADSYGPEVSERLIAEALHPYPEDLVIATKGGFERPGPSNWQPNCHPKRLRRCCEDSLRRLKLERIDLYQLHTVDPQVPIEDSIGAMAELQQEEMIRYIGVSNVSVEQLERARSIAEVVSVQNRYSVSDRSSEDVLEVCERDGLGFLPWAPLSADVPARLALAWLLQRSEVMLPIPGTGSIDHFDENLEAAELELDEDEFERLSSSGR